MLDLPQAGAARLARSATFALGDVQARHSLRAADEAPRFCTRSPRRRLMKTRATVARRPVPARIALLFMLTACGQYTVPAVHVENARNTIDAARVAGAATSRHGRIYLESAQNELSEAMKSSGKHADLLLLRSQVDADLALALTRQDLLEGQAARAIQQAEGLTASQPAP
jgi:hypothetical protein